MSTSEIATVLAWHDALSSGDLDTLESLSSGDIEIGDHHGAGQGHAQLRQQRAAGCPEFFAPAPVLRGSAAAAQAQPAAARRS